MRALNVAGWFMRKIWPGRFAAIRPSNAIGPRVRQDSDLLVAGPWAHGDWIRRPDGAGVQAAAAQYYRERILLPFFEHFLKGAPDPHLAKATMFETGASRWHTYADVAAARQAAKAHLPARGWKAVVRSS